MEATGELTSGGTMPVGDDIRTPGGIRAALLALLVEGGFGRNFLDAGLFPVLDNMTVHVRDGGDGVTTVRAEGEIVRPGSQRAVARGHVVDANDPSRLLAFAHIGYWMIQPRSEYMRPSRNIRLASASAPSRDAEGGGSPRRYLPVRRPLASGKYASSDIPLRSSAAITSSPGRSRTLYCS